MSKIRYQLEPNERKTMIQLVAEREVTTAQKEAAIHIEKARHAACEFYALTVIKDHKFDPKFWMLSDDLAEIVERPKQKVTPIRDEQSGTQESQAESSAEEVSQVSAKG